MAQLIVRNIEDDVKDRLVQRARRHGHSMEEEVRDILRNAVRESSQGSAQGLGSRLAALFEGLDMPEIEELKGAKIEPADFGDDDR